jgi:hypothetical protein
MADLRYLGNQKWQDRRTLFTFDGSAEPYCLPGIDASSIFNFNDRDAQWADTYQIIIICDQTLREIPNLGQSGNTPYIPFTIASRQALNLVTAETHLQTITLATVSTILLHESFHCAYHFTSSPPLSFPL